MSYKINNIYIKFDLEEERYEVLEPQGLGMTNNSLCHNIHTRTSQTDIKEVSGTFSYNTYVNTRLQFEFRLSFTWPHNSELIPGHYTELLYLLHNYS